MQLKGTSFPPSVLEGVGTLEEVSQALVAAEENEPTGLPVKLFRSMLVVKTRKFLQERAEELAQLNQENLQKESTGPKDEEPLRATNLPVYLTCRARKRAHSCDNGENVDQNEPPCKKRSPGDGAGIRTVPLSYLYRRLLLLPRRPWDIVGGRDSQRLGSSSEHNLSTPLDSGGCGQEAAAMPTVMPPRARTPPFYHVQLSHDTRSLAENGFGPNWINEMSSLVVEHLNEFGLCVLEGFFGEERADKVLAEVQNMHEHGVFTAGQVVSRQVQEHARGQIRGDKIAWVTGSESHCQNIGQLAKLVDAVIASANKHPSAGKLADYNIKWRTKAMVACYPGQGTRYVRHMDNPNGDGRCITAIYYINKDWREEHGGILRIYPEDNNDQVANIEPLFDRMLFFWSDRRNPHEVLPSNKTRYAITIWYLDQKEREEYLSQENHMSSAT